MDSMDRRTFLAGSVLGAASTLFEPIGGIPPSILPSSRTNAKDDRPIIRTLGRTGIKLPIVSMGVMRADNPGLVRAALEAGMTHLDTAHGYQKGKNETMLGEVLKSYPRDSFVIATKIPPDSKERFLAMLDTSLERLQMSYVDILYLHGISDRSGALSKELLDAITSAKRAGKVRHIGMSTHRNEPEVIRAAIESGVYEVVLTSINFMQDHAAEIRTAVAEAAKAGIGIVAMKTMAGGFFDKARTKPINCKAALKWVLQDANITTAIPGITSFEHLKENAGVLQDCTLLPQEVEDLNLGKSESGLYCQGCEQCLRQCRRALPIPDLMRAYMYTYGYGNAADAKELLTRHGIDQNPCSECGTCSVACAKGFPVSDRIADISRLSSVPEEFLA